MISTDGRKPAVPRSLGFDSRSRSFPSTMVFLPADALGRKLKSVMLPLPGRFPGNCDRKHKIVVRINCIYGILFLNYCAAPYLANLVSLRIFITLNSVHNTMCCGVKLSFSRPHGFPVNVVPSLGIPGNFPASIICSVTGALKVKITIFLPTESC